MIRDRLIKLVYAELESAIADREDRPLFIAERIVDKLLTGREVWRSGRRIYDRLRERLLHRPWG